MYFNSWPHKTWLRARLFSRARDPLDTNLLIQKGGAAQKYTNWSLRVTYDPHSPPVSSMVIPRYLLLPAARPFYLQSDTARVDEVVLRVIVYFGLHVGQVAVTQADVLAREFHDSDVRTHM